MLKSGTYLLYELEPTEGKPEQHMVGRFMVEGDQFHILEDHNNILSDHLSDGLMTPNHQKALFNLLHSGYFRIIPEDEINEGHHEDQIEDLDIGNTEPDATYLVSGPTLDEPKVLEMYGDNCVLDGKKLSEEEIKGLMQNIHNDVLKLIHL